MINISYIPYHHPIIDYASSRLRCFFHHENLNQYHSTNFTSTIGINPDLADLNIAIITQKISDENLQKLIDFKNSRKDNIVIYDIVDSYYTDPKVKTMFSLSNFIFVANETQKQLISKHVTKKVFVLEDCIDYREYIDPTIVPTNNKVVWFGNNTGLNNIRSFLLGLQQSKYDINIIGKCSYYKRYISGATCVEWNYNTFISNLRQNSIALLTHDLNQQQKSNNKMLVCVANSIPVLSYQSKSYDQLLSKFGLNYAIIHNRSDLLNAIKTLSQPEARRKYFEEIQPFVLENFSSRKITEKLVSIIDEIQHPNQHNILSPHRVSIRLNKKEVPVEVKHNLTSKKILLYTANFGNYDLFHEIQHTFPDYIDYLYITDTPRESRTWKVKVVENTGNPIMSAKMYKVLPHRFFPEYDISIWIDASAKNIHSNFLSLIKYLDRYNFIITRHPSRSCVYDEANVCISGKKDCVETITTQVERYKLEDYPEKFGLFQCGFLIRKNIEVQEFSERWWTEILNNSKRDQISFPYVYNQYKESVKLKVLDPKICLDHFHWRRHGNERLIKPVIFRKKRKI